MKTPVTIIWRDPAHDWHWFWLRDYDGARLTLTGADDPAGYKHDGDTFVVHKDEIRSITSGHRVVSYAGAGAYQITKLEV